MVPVVLLSQNPDRLAKRFYETLSRYEKTTVFSPGYVALPDDSAKFAIIGTGQLESYNAPFGVLVIHDPPPTAKRLKLSSGIVPLIVSDSRRSRRLLRDCENPTVCCGMSQRDTLTLSSITGDRALVCVRRSIELPGTELDEGEIGVDIGQPCDADTVMLLTAALLIGGVEPPDSGFLI